MKTRSASRIKSPGCLQNLVDKTEMPQTKMIKQKINQLADSSDSSDENVIAHSKVKTMKRIRLASDSSCSSESSKIIGNSRQKTKSVKRTRLSVSSDVESQSKSSEESDNASVDSDTSDGQIKSPKKKGSLRSSSNSSSAESDTDRSQPSSSSYSSDKSSVSKRKLKKSKRIRFLRNTSSSSDESEKLDTTSLLKFKLKKLRFAVSYNNTNQVREIIAHQYVKLNSREFGNLLWRAFENKNLEIMSMLIRAEVDVNVRGFGDDRDNTLLHAVVSKASEKNFEDLALLLMEYEADIEEVDGNGNSVLHCAIEGGSLLLIEKLLELGADITAINKLGENILYATAKSPLAEKLLPLFVQYNVPDLKTKNSRAMEGLRYLIKTSGNVAAMRALLDLKVPINEKDYRDSTLLDYAMDHRDICSLEIVKLLLEYGADPTKKRSDGCYPLCLASSFKVCSMAALFIKNGASIHACNDNGQYPIHVACNYGSLKNIGLLLFLGADINIVDYRGLTPFSLMCTYYLHDASKMMIKHFAVLASKNCHVNESDLLQVYTHTSMKEYYDRCLDELTNMRKLTIYNDITAYCILTGNVQKLTQLIRNKDFAKSYYQNLRDILGSFPIYSSAIQKLFNIALKIRKTMIRTTDALDEATNFILPEEIWEIITFYSCCNRLVDFYV